MRRPRRTGKKKEAIGWVGADAPGDNGPKMMLKLYGRTVLAAVGLLVVVEVEAARGAVEIIVLGAAVKPVEG